MLPNRVTICKLEQHLQWMGGFMLAMILCAPAGAVAAETTSGAELKPNFVIILADDLGYNDLGSFGSPHIKTPHLDKLAADGARFTDWYAAPACTPSRAALLTGCYPARVGFGDNLGSVGGRKSPSSVLHPQSPYGLNAEEHTLPEVLKTAGYATGMVGKWHLGDAPEFNPTLHGFDFFFGMPYSNDMKPYYYLRGTERLPDAPDNDLITQTITREAVGFIGKHKDAPFLLYMAHAMPHTPLGASPGFKGKSPRGLYGDAVQEVDWSVGEIVKAVGAIGATDRTLIVFLSDNGPWLIRGENGGSATPLRNGKGSTYDGGIRVPCVMSWPGTVPAGTVCKQVATNMDVLPTLASLAGAELPATPAIDGKNITALLKDPEGAESPTGAFYYYFGNQLHGVRSGKWKLRLENNLKNENIYRREPEDLLKSIKMPAALYNLEDDPGEQKDVMRNHPQVVKRLRQAAEQARTDLGDSLTSVSGTNLRPIGTVQKP